MLRRWAVAATMTAAIGAAAVIGACSLFQGSTDAYTPQPATAEEGGLGCFSSANCDAGSVCCLAASLATQTLSTTCQSDPCASSDYQLCATSAECGNAPCILQVCSSEGVAAVVGGCSLLPTCSPVVSGSVGADAGVDGGAK